MEHQSKRKRGPQVSTLTPLIRHFIGLELRVELKNGRSYYGYLEDCDDTMNLTLSSSSSLSSSLSSCEETTTSPSFASNVTSNSHIASIDKTDQNNDEIKIRNSKKKELSSNANATNENENDDEEENDAISMGIFQFSKIHIRGSTIRYIQFPDNADLAALIRIGFDRKRAAQDKYARGKRQKR